MVSLIRRKDTGQAWETEVDSGGGTPTAGAVIVHGPFSFAYNTPNLTTGVSFYTPSVGEIILNIQIWITTLWDGTTPTGDVGQFVMATTGLLKNSFSGVGTTLMDSPTQTVNDGVTNYGAAALGEFAYLFSCTTADPLKVVVSQDGTKGGSDPGSSQGQAQIYIVTATPVALP